VALVTTPVWAWLADSVGRKPVFIGGALASAALMWPFLWAIAHADIAALFISGVLLFGFAYSAANGIWPALYGEMFDTSVRLSGMAIGTQIGFAIAGVAPALCAVWMARDNGYWTGVAALVSTACVVAALAVASARETRSLPTAALGILGDVKRNPR
jgi:MFS family permease